MGIAAGNGTSVALKGNGSVVAWGFGGNNQTNVPTGLTNVIAISMHSGHALALKRDGTVAAWGLNTYGQASVPIGLANVIAVAAGGAHSLALKADGTVVAWGSFSGTNVPVGLANVVAITAGAAHSLALKADGMVAAWGTVWNGSADVPVNLPAGLTDLVAITAGNAHDLALVGDGSPVFPVRLFNPVLSNKTFNVSTATTRGRAYFLEFKDSLQDANWTMLPPVPGDGTIRNLVDPAPNVPKRFYRVRQQ